MKLRVYLKDGKVLDFLERPESLSILKEKLSLAKVSNNVVSIFCENGEFLIYPDNISYCIYTPDETLEPDQK